MQSRTLSRRRLGRTGKMVSVLGHGLWGMGDWSDASDTQSQTALTQSADAGCSFYDSAWAYGNGHSDKLLGGLLSARQQNGILAGSKVPPKNLQWPATSAYRYEDVFPFEHVIAYAERSREAMGVETIDLLQLHVWDDSWTAHPGFERTVKHLKDTGLISAFGLSLNRWEPENGIQAVETGLIDTVQVIYNIFDQAPEDKLFPICEQHDVGVIARVPLDEGSLGGNLTLDTRFPEGDFRAMYFGPENLPETVERVEQLKEAVPAGMSLPEMAIRFILSHKVVSTIAIGMRKSQHIEANIVSAERGALPDEVITMLRDHRWDRTPTAWSG
ncbi:MAG: aldo/keto reductase [Pseudomonadota bacterium]